jgi:hypothetical protein
MPKKKWLVFMRRHEDECIINCPVPPGEKCRIGHWCWCSTTRAHLGAAIKAVVV